MLTRRSRYRSLAKRLIEWADALPESLENERGFHDLRDSVSEIPNIWPLAVKMGALVAVNLHIASGISPRHVKRYLPALAQEMEIWSPDSYQELMSRLKQFDGVSMPRERLGELVLNDLFIRRPFSVEQSLLAAFVGKILLDHAEQWILGSAKNGF